MKFVVTMCFYFSFKLVCSAGNWCQANEGWQRRRDWPSAGSITATLPTSDFVMALIGGCTETCTASSWSFQHHLFGFQLHRSQFKAFYNRHLPACRTDCACLATSRLKSPENIQWDESKLETGPVCETAQVKVEAKYLYWPLRSIIQVGKIS